MNEIEEDIYEADDFEVYYSDNEDNDYNRLTEKAT